ncbi:MAG: cysteine--tRNA ligase [bacterium]
MHLTLYNTLTRRHEPLVPADPANVSFYSCGPTVYDDAHIGNFRSFLAADTLRRFVQSPLCRLAGTPDGGSAHQSPTGRTVTHVMNITDVGHMTDDDNADGSGEDKMAEAGRRLTEAKKAGMLPADVQIDPKDPYAISRFYADRFLADARALGLLVAIQAERDPSLMPRPTQFIGAMVQMIAMLIKRGHAYAVGEPGKQVVYFDVQSFAAYGRLSNNTLEALRSGEGGRVLAANQSQKKHPADFLLWKHDPSHIMKWPTPWGEGYPGWHIECSARAMARLGQAAVAREAKASQPGTPLLLGDENSLIDLHSGGEDNIFPHHECEIAQSCCALCRNPARGSFARMWVHCRHLMVEGEKMSKRKGNFHTARDLFARGVLPGALRLELIRTHYRSQANFTMQGLSDCQRMIDRWRRVYDAPPGDAAIDPLTHPVLTAFAAPLHEDLKVAGAIAEVNTWVNGIASPTAQDAAVMRHIDAVLGVLDRPVPTATATAIGVYVGGAQPTDEVEGLLAERAQARKAKDFAASDRIRDRLAAMGLTIKDVPGGKVEVGRRA